MNEKNEGIYFGTGNNQKKFLRIEVILERLDLTEKTLYILAESGEFSIGRIGTKDLVLAESFFDYLNRNHFTKRIDKEDRPAIDSKGRLKYKLTPVKEKHDDIPVLLPIQFFADDLGVDKRTFTKHCESGAFKHYRIGTLYKMSKKDYEDSLEKAFKENLKEKGKRSVGRPKKVKSKMVSRKKEIESIE